METDVKISSRLDDEDPHVYHLIADRELGGPGAVQPLMQRILNIPGINGVRRSDGRTIIVEKIEGEDWQSVQKTIDDLFRDHFKGNGDARQKGPKGHTRFGATLENLWGYYRQCDRFAVKAKAELQRDRRYSLWALGATSVLGLLCAEKISPFLFGPLSAVAAGLSAYLTKRSSSPEKEHQWVRSRALAEDAKSECIKFLVRCDPYDKEDAVAKLADKAARVRQTMADIGEFEEMDKSSRLTGLPKDWLTMDDYLLERVKDQADWYGRKSRQHRKDAERLQALVMVFSVAAAVLGVTPFLVGDLPSGSPTDPIFQSSWADFDAVLRSKWSLPSFADMLKEGHWLAIGLVRALKLLGSSGWISVLTSLTGAVTTYHFQNRLDFMSLVYKQTRGKLEASIAEWTDQVPPADKPSRQSEYVQRFETILNQEHAQWISELDKSAPAGASAPPALDGVM